MNKVAFHPLLPLLVFLGLAVFPSPSSAAVGTILCSINAQLYKCVEGAIDGTAEYISCGCKNKKECDSRGISVNTSSALPCSQYEVKTIRTIVCKNLKTNKTFKCADVPEEDRYKLCGCSDEADCGSKGISVAYYGTPGQVGLCKQAGVDPKAAPPPSKAAPAGAGAGPASQFKLPAVELTTLIGRVIRLILGVSGSLAFGAILLGGLFYLTSAGNPETITKARNIIVWAGLGLIVIFAAYALVNVVIGALGTAVGLPNI